MAATLYHLLTGQKQVDALQRVLGQSVLAPAYVAHPTVPPRISLVLDRAMSLRPEDRFTSVDDFMRVLTDFNDHATLRVSPQSVTLPQYPPPPLIPPEPPPAALPGKPPARRGPWLWIGGLVGLAVLAAAAFFLFNQRKPGSAAEPIAGTTLTASLAPVFTLVSPTQAPTPLPTVTI